MSFEVILVAVLMFFVLVGVHEWGHFYFAKRVGILAREFAIGFGPKILSFKKGETQYTFRIFPMGGYVRMAGEDPELVQIKEGQTIAIQLQEGKVSHLYLDKLDERTQVIVGTVVSIDLEHQLQVQLEFDGETVTYEVQPDAMIVARGRETQIAPWNRQFGSKTVGQRALVIAAGPIMNFILAFVLFFAFIMLNGVPVKNPTYLKIGNVLEDTPAEQVGLQANDIVYSVNGEPIAGDSEKLIQLIEKSVDEPMTWEIIRNEERLTVQITPENIEGEGKVGVTIQTPTRTPSVLEGLQGAGKTMVNASVQTLDAIRMLVTFQLSMDDLGGPVRIAEVTGEAYSLGVVMLLFWVAFLSLYLGIFNLLPFPALDGSRLMFFLAEAIRGKPVDPHRESMVHFIGFAMLMLLIIAVTYNDIMRLFKG